MSSTVSVSARHRVTSASRSVDPAMCVVMDGKAVGPRGVLYAMEQALGGSTSIVQHRLSGMLQLSSSSTHYLRDTSRVVHFNRGYVTSLLGGGID